MMTVTLRSSDKKLFEVDVTVAKESLTIKPLIEEIKEEGGRVVKDSVIPLQNVNASTLKKVIAYCEKSVDMKGRDGGEVGMKIWSYGFMDDYRDDVFDLMMAEDYLYIPGLLDLTLDTVAKRIKGKTPEEIRTIFGIENDYTPEEEAKFMRENQWAFGK